MLVDRNPQTILRVRLDQASAKTRQYRMVGDIILRGRPQEMQDMLVGIGHFLNRFIAQTAIPNVGQQHLEQQPPRISRGPATSEPCA